MTNHSSRKDFSMFCKKSKIKLSSLQNHDMTHNAKFRRQHENPPYYQNCRDTAAISKVENRIPLAVEKFTNYFKHPLQMKRKKNFG